MSFDIQTPTVDRRRYQREVDGLLEIIRARVAELELAKAYGVRGGGLAAYKRDLGDARKRLAQLVRGTAGGDEPSAACC